MGIICTKSTATVTVSCFLFLWSSTFFEQSAPSFSNLWICPCASSQPNDQKSKYIAKFQFLSDNVQHVPFVVLKNRCSMHCFLIYLKSYLLVRKHYMHSQSELHFSCSHPNSLISHAWQYFSLGLIALEFIPFFKAYIKNLPSLPTVWFVYLHKC